MAQCLFSSGQDQLVGSVAQMVELVLRNFSGSILNLPFMGHKFRWLQIGLPARFIRSILTSPWVGPKSDWGNLQCTVSRRNWWDNGLSKAYCYNGCLQRFGIAIQGLPCNCHLFLVMALDITHIIWVIILPSSNQQCHNQCLMLLEFLRGFINFRLLTVKMLSAQQKRVAHWNLIIYAKLLSVVH